MKLPLFQILAILTFSLLGLRVDAIDFADLPAVYDQLRTCGAGETFAVSNLTIVRGAAAFRLKSGVVQLLPPVHGRYHGAFFSGDGIFEFIPPSSIERDQLKKFTGEKSLEEPFTSVAFRFTDDTGTLLLAGKSPAESALNLEAYCSQTTKELREKYSVNADARILRDFYAGRSDFFVANISSRSKGRFLMEIDPEEPEDVALLQHRDRGFEFIDTWSSFSSRNKAGSLHEPAEIPHFELDIRIQKNGDISATAELTVVSRGQRLREVAFNLSPLIEVTEILDDRKRPCHFVYETVRDKIGEPPIKQNKLDVFLSDDLEEGNERKIYIAYKSKDLIEKLPRSNKEYVIRDTTGWYPTIGFLQRSKSRITYRYPSDLQLLAAGKKIKEWKENDDNCSLWEQTTPVAFLCFNLGDFKHKQLSADGLPPADIFGGKSHRGIRIGGRALDNVAADIVNSLTFFQQLFAPYPFPSITATEIPAYHGQGFPGFLHLSKRTFDDVQLAGIDEAFRGHEVSHQWWGHLVGWETYHDQWLSEGFAEYSGALFADMVQSGSKKKSDLLPRMLEHWRNDILHFGTLSFHRFGMGKFTSKDSMGTQSGPIWLGYRLASSRSPIDYQILVYEKGAYVLHMLRMMMRDWNTNSDDAFFEMMRDFVRTYSWKNASTEDFQSIAEKHVGTDLKWFFDQWVYGTDVPRYKFSWTSDRKPDGTYVLNCRIEQSGVPEDFRMPVPVFIRFGGDRHALIHVPVDQPVKTLALEVPEKPVDVKFNWQLSVLSYRD